MDRIAVVILNWNGVEYLKRFLAAVVRFSASPGTSVYLADNFSTDNSVQWTEDNHPSVKIIRLNRNYGFAGGYNRALSNIIAEYFVLINSDIEVTENWLQNMAEMMDSDPKIAACQPKILSWEKREYFEYAGAAGGFIDRHGFPFCRGRIISTVEKDTGQYDDSRDLFWASGACMMVRSAAWKECGAFDDDFCAHMEEIDLCWRFLLAGYTIRLVPGSVVYHVGGGTLPYESPFKTFLNFRNNLYLLYKNLPERNHSIRIFTRMLFDGAAGCMFLFTGRFKHLKAVWNAHMDYYRNRNILRSKRMKVIRTHPDNPGNYILNKSVVFQFYILGRKTFTRLNANL